MKYKKTNVFLSVSVIIIRCVLIASDDNAKGNKTYKLN